MGYYDTGFFLAWEKMPFILLKRSVLHTITKLNNEFKKVSGLIKLKIFLLKMLLGWKKVIIRLHVQSYVCLLFKNMADQLNCMSV